MKHLYKSLDKSPRVDAQNGVIHGVSLIQSGDAAGHFDDKGRQEVVDSVTLEQMFKYCKGKESIKVKADHGTGVFSTVGYVDNFALTSDKLLGDLHIYDAEPERDRLFEIADKNPEHMGISLEFEGKDKPSGNVSLVRCEVIHSAALVSDPAANKSLFSKDGDPEQDQKNKHTTTMADNKKEDDKPSVEDRLDELSKKFEEMTAQYAKKFDSEDEDEDEGEGDDKESEKKLKIEKLKKELKKLEDGEPDGDENVVAKDPKKEPAESDPKKTYTEDDLKKTAEFAAQSAVKHFASKIGVTNLGKPGATVEQKKEKHFEEHVVDLATTSFKGDLTAARVEILTHFSKYPDAKKAYEAQRQVKHS